MHEDDYDRGLEFCEQMQNVCNANAVLVKNMLFSDQAFFCLYSAENIGKIVVIGLQIINVE